MSLSVAALPTTQTTLTVSLDLVVGAANPYRPVDPADLTHGAALVRDEIAMEMLVHSRVISIAASESRPREADVCYPIEVQVPAVSRFRAVGLVRHIFDQALAEVAKTGVGAGLRAKVVLGGVTTDVDARPRRAGAAYDLTATALSAVTGSPAVPAARQWSTVAAAAPLGLGTKGASGA